MPVKSSHGYAAVLVVLLTGVGLSLWLFQFGQRYESGRMMQTLTALANERTVALQSETDALLEVLYSLKGLTLTSSGFNANDFNLFIAEVFPRHRNLRLIGWIPRVPGQRRHSFEQEAVQEGYAGFQIAEYNATGALVRAPLRNEYYPLYHIASRETFVQSRGLDLGDELLHAGIIEKANASGGMVASAHKSHAHNVSGVGVELYMPMYRGNRMPDTREKRADALLGLLVMEIGLEQFIISSLERYAPAAGGLDIYLFDKHGERLYFHRSRARQDKTGLQPDSMDHLLMGLHVNSGIIVADQKWTLLFKPAPELVEEHYTLLPEIAMLSGVLITVLVAIYFMALHRRQDEIGRVVKQRTEELGASREEFRAVLNTVVDGIISISRDGVIQSINPAVEKIFGYSQHELAGQNISMLMSSQDAREHDRYLKNLLKSGNEKSKAIGHELLGQRKDGSTFPMEIGIGEMRVGKQRMFTEVVRDITDRKLAEQHVLDREARIQAIVDTVVDGIVTISDRGIVETFNPAAERLFGYSTREVVGNNVNILMPEPYAREHDGYLSSYINTGEARIIGIGREVVGRHKDGSVFPMELAVSEMRVGGERKFTGIVRDITGRKQAEQALHDSEVESRKLALVASRTQNAVVITDAEGYTEWVNEGFTRITGFTLEDMYHKKPGELLQGPDSDPHVVRYMSDQLAAGKGFKTEVINYTRDGNKYWLSIEIQPIYDDTGAITNFIAIESDITKQKETQQHLEEVSQLRQAILDSADYSIISADPVGVIQTFNRGAENMLGYAEEEVVGKQTPALFHDYGEIEARARELSEELGHPIAPGFEVFVANARLGHVDENEWTYIRKDGSRFPVQLSVTTLCDQQGTITGFLGIGKDITESKKVERMKNEFVSTVSHELRTPLTSIRGALSLVLGKSADELSDKTRYMLEMANRNSERLTLLINDILDLEKIESGSLDFEFRPVDLVEISHQALGISEGFARQHDVNVRFDATVNSAPVYGDSHRLLQVFDNLISNAIKFSPRQGEVEVRLTRENDQYRVSIRDQGTGIPEEFHGKIFERFSQADSSDSRAKGGTGLGLSISRAIVERHHGVILFDSRPGDGSLFYFDLPALHARSEQSEGDVVGARVLICEDNQDVAFVLSSLLRNEGLASEVATSAQMCKEMLSRNRYDLLLLDLMLPDKDGLTLLHELRVNKITSEIPVIVVSGRAEEGRTEFTGDAVMVVDWLQKPVDQKRFSQAIYRALHGDAHPVVLHIEDDPDIVQVSQVLLKGIAEFESASSLAQARRRLQERHFDLVILDLSLPDGSGLDLFDEIDADCPVVIFSGRELSEEVSGRVAAALTKSKSSNEELLGTIKNVLNRGRSREV